MQDNRIAAIAEALDVLKTLSRLELERAQKAGTSTDKAREVFALVNDAYKQLGTVAQQLDAPAEGYRYVEKSRTGGRTDRMVDVRLLVGGQPTEIQGTIRVVYEPQDELWHAAFIRDGSIEGPKVTAGSFSRAVANLAAKLSVRGK